MTPATLLVATTNRGKLREVRAALGCLPVKIMTLDDFPRWPEPVEDAETFEGNARLKALHYARLSGGWALADDSGLEVDALGLPQSGVAAPGVRSARYAGPVRDDAANNSKLIEQLAGVPTERRTARFRCAIALADSEGVLATASGVLEGRIVDKPRGNNGFGYDPHFYVPEHDLTTAEMTPDQKNRISHRGQALRAIRPEIERLLAQRGRARS